MYEDFSYITDEHFLTKYWDAEKLLCPYCEGMGKLSFDGEPEMVNCHLCNGSGWVTHQQYEKSVLKTHIAAKHP